jgi:hypothetical protein
VDLNWDLHASIELIDEGYMLSIRQSITVRNHDYQLLCASGHKYTCNVPVLYLRVPNILANDVIPSGYLERYHRFSYFNFLSQVYGGSEHNIR